MTFTIEPMINAGKRDLKVLGDGWTVVTRDRSLSAQWEHTLAVTDDGYEIFTLGAAERANDNAAAFTLCHLIIIQSALAQTCPFTLSYYWEHYRTQRAQLPPRLQDQLDTAYQHAHKHGLIDDTFRPPSP